MKTKAKTPKKTGRKTAVSSSASKLLKELDKARQKLEGLQGDMASLIQPLTDVEDISIFSQPGDGFVICDIESNNAPLDKCLQVILKKGRLSKQDYEGLTI